jgi:hypothetical protein
MFILPDYVISYSRVYLLLFAFLGIPFIAAAQQSPLRGVVWQEPADVRVALQDLMQMDSVGVQAVRTGIIRNEQVLTLADTLGIQIFQDLPVAYLPASHLTDTLAFASRLLNAALIRSRNHPSARHFGLGTMNDTSTPEACRYFAQLTQYVRQQGLSGARTYYVTPFIENDRCANMVDLVLVNALDSDTPAQLLEKWDTARGDSTVSAVGIGLLGTPAVGDTLSRAGRARAAAQARYLERQLNLLTRGRIPVRPYAVFIYRWSDVSGDRSDAVNPAGASYGLIQADGTRRPAYNVVHGLYTGQQTVFALEAEEEQVQPWPWRIFLGWGGITLLAGFYAASPRLRFMVPRYFTAHGFYRDAVREGRDVLVASSTALLAVLTITVGLVMTVLVDQLSREQVFGVFLQGLSESTRAYVLSLSREPLTAFLLFAGVYALSALLWSGILSLISQRRYSLSPAQTLMLVVWPRWPLLLLLPIAMVIPTLAPDAALTWTYISVGLFLLISVFTVIRTAYDFITVTRVPIGFAVLTWVTSPLVLLAVAAAVTALLNSAETQFLYHLLVHR